MTAASTAASRPSTVANADAAPVSWAAASTSTTPHDSDDSTNSTGNQGVAHRGTALKLCSSSPVYSMTASAANASAACSTCTAAKRQRRTRPSQASPASTASTAQTANDQAPTATCENAGLVSRRRRRSARPTSASRHTMPNASATSAAL